MNERDIFNAALLIQGNTAREAYLETACAGDVVLRRRVETLLQAHESASRFLERPALLELAAEDGPTGDRPVRHDGIGHGAGERTEQFDPRGETETCADGDEDEPPLDFLQASEKPGSLGRLAHYEVLEVLGKGGFGTVVKAFDEKLHRKVAIKVMDRGLAATSPPRKRFLREARASAAVRHENVVSIHAVDERPIPYLVMEYIAGQTLQQKLDRVGPFEIAEVLRIGHQIADGLAAAHGQGLIHRDIKPGNILLEDGVERVKITDFGLARAADDASLTQSGIIAGTPMYMAPEQALGGPIDQRADLFSLGSVLYVMCTGRPPFRASTILAVLKRVAEDSPRPIREIIPEVPEWLCTIIARLHAKDPADRFASAQEVADLLKGHLAALRSPRGAHPVFVPPPPSSRPEPAAIDPEFMTTARSSGAGTRSKDARPRAVSRHLWALAAAVVAGLGVTELSGITDIHGAVVRHFSPEGTLNVYIDDPGVNFLINGEGVVIHGYGTRELRLKPGRYRFLARKGDRVLKHEPLTIERNGHHAVLVSQEPVTVPTASAPPLPAKDLGPWGQFLDPRGGSRAWREGERLTITVPGDTPRDLNPIPGFNLDAPRVLQPVNDDFTIQVTVLPFPRPGPRTTYTTGADSYHGAGLLVWADARNFLRFELAGLSQADGGAPFTHLELFRDGRKTDEELRWTFEAPTYLQVERRGDSLFLRTSPDGRAWTDYKTCTLIGMPPKVLVGVAATNSEAKEFAPQFEGWSLKSAGTASPEPGPSP